VDYRKVNFVEASFPQHADLLRGGSVDAVVSADPFMSRITESGAGYVASYYSTFLPENNQTIVHAAKREWVAKNPATARAFREALVESGGFMQQAKNDAQVRTAIGDNSTINAMGYSIKDNYLYARQSANNTLIKIDNLGNASDNTKGIIYGFPLVGGTGPSGTGNYFFVSNGPTSTSNDGARCVTNLDI
jgi:ABC-type nitrate/sulfonate/bicarbonate transport system substrate-binding protein